MFITNQNFSATGTDNSNTNQYPSSNTDKNKGSLGGRMIEVVENSNASLYSKALYQETDYQRNRQPTNNQQQFSLRKLLRINHSPHIQSAIFYINEAKSSKQSMYVWAKNLVTLAQDKQFTKEELILQAYEIYTTDIPKFNTELSQERKERLILVLDKANQNRLNKFYIKPQRFDGLQFYQKFKRIMKNDKDLAFSDIYRFLPKKHRYLGYSNARITLTIEPKYAEKVVKLLSELMNGPFQETGICQAKIMGLNELNTRTDSAVIYLKSANQAHAENIAQLIESKLDDRVLKVHTPFGMKSLSRGISYSEKSTISSSSHGLARSAIIADAVEEYLNSSTTKDLNLLVDQHNQAHGYKIDDPALIRQDTFNTTIDVLFKKS